MEGERTLQAEGTANVSAQRPEHSGMSEDQ